MSLDLILKDSEFNFKMVKPSNNKVYEFEKFRLDAAHLMLYRENEEISLAPKAVETLIALVDRRGEILSKDELMEVIWTDSIVEESNLSQYLHILRKTLGNQQDGQPFIETLRRRGYRFNGKVSVSESSNGNLPQIDAADLADSHPADNESVVVNPNPRPLRVERHGNVLALADWKELETEPQPVINVAPKLLASTSGSNLSRLNRYAAAIVISIIIFGAFGYFWFRSQSNSAQATAKSDVVFMNLTDGEDVNNATISPDGNFFVYNSRDGDKSRLFVRQTGQSVSREITEPLRDGILGFAFTPDSQFIYFVADDNGHRPNTLYRVPIFGGVRTKILSDIATMPSFSPDGNEMVFMRGIETQSSILIAASDGSRERTLLTVMPKDTALNGGGSWSPDGRTIAYGAVDMNHLNSGGCSIVGIDPDSGVTRPLSQDRWDTCYRMAWTRDSQGLVFIGTKANEAFSTRRDQVYYVSIPDGTSRRITTDGNRYQVVSLGVSDKDEIIAVSFNRLSQIWSMQLDGNARDATQITTGFADGRGGIAPLNDGRVAYVTRNGDGFSIWTMNADGSNRKQLTTDPPAMQELRSPTDGSFFVFSAFRDAWNRLYRVDADGANLKQLTFGDSNAADSTISPDGKWIVYDSSDYSTGRFKAVLSKVSSDGGESVKISDLECQSPHFSPDGASVSCVSADWKTISIISVETGETTRTLKTEANAVLNFGAHWTPDGKSLAYIVSTNLVGNILTQPINGEEPRPLTDFQSGDIYNFAFSTDGTRLFMARGYQTKKAVLIKNFR